MTKSRRTVSNLPSLDTETLSLSSSGHNYALENFEHSNTHFEHPFMDSDIDMNYSNCGFESGEDLAQVDGFNFESMHVSGPVLYPGVQADDSPKVHQNSPLHQTSEVITQTSPLETNTEQSLYNEADKRYFNVFSIHPISHSNSSGCSILDRPPIVYADILPKQIDILTHNLTNNHFGSQNASGVSSPDPNEENVLMNPQEIYIGLVPLINKSNPLNFPHILIEVSRICQNHVSLDDFYKLLLWDERRTQINEFPGLERVDRLEPSIYRNEGLKLYEFVLRTFKFPGVDVGDFAAGLVKNQKLSAIRFDHARCTFLAIKILLDCTIEVERPLKATSFISRSSIRLAYYIIGRAILQKYGKISRSSQSLESILLKKPQVGRILNLLYKDFPRRRLGRRGSSEFYYFGLTWNENIIDDEILRMINAEEQKMERISKRTEKYQPREKHTTEETEVDPVLNAFGKSNFHGCARYSFISTNSISQTSEYSPIDWETFLDETPPSSTWVSSIISKSTAVLRKFAIDFTSMIREFFSTVNSHEQQNDGILGFFKAMETLQRQRVHEKVYLHLFLAMLLSTHSLSLCVEESNSSKCKIQEQTTLKTFFNELKARQSYFAGKENNHYLTFMALIEKIIQVIELSRVEVEMFSTKDTVEKFVRDMKRVTEPDFSTEDTGINEAIITAVIHSINAYDGSHDGKVIRESPENKHAHMMKITESFSEFFKQFVERVGDIPKSMKEQNFMQSRYNLAFHIFVISVKEFHKSCLSNQDVMELPIQTIRAILSRLTDNFIRVSFENFRKRDSELSKQVFKTFWVWTFMLNEYVRIHLEIVALAGRIMEDEDGG